MAPHRIDRTMMAISRPIRDALSSYWRSGAFIAGLGLIAVGAATTVDGLGHARADRDDRVVLEPLPPAVNGVDWTPDALPLNAVRGEATKELLGLLSLTAWAVIAVAAGSVLVISAGRARARRTEVQVRRAVGASRRVLLGAFAGEGVVLTVATAVGGIALGGAGAYQAARSWPGVPAEWHPVSIAVVAIVALVTLVGALFPLGYSRTRRVGEIPPLPPSLVLASIQLGVALTVLVTSSLLQRRAAEMLATAAPSSNAVGRWSRLDLHLLDEAARSAAYARLLRSLRADPEVELASLSTPGTLVGLGTVDYLETDCGNCYVGGIYLKWRVLRATYHSASADTFYARGLTLAEGRNFSVADSLGAKPVAIVNRYLAARYFEGGHPIGRSIWLGGRVSGAGYEVVGVVDDGQPSGFGGGLLPREAVYLSTLQHPPAVADLLVRTAGSGAPRRRPDPLAPALGRVSMTRSEREYLDGEAAPVTWFARWFRLQGWIALLLATAGVLGLMRLWVEALRPELALRRAVGAKRAAVAGFVVARAALMGLRGVFVAVVFFGPFLWGELARLAPGTNALPIPLIARFGTLLVGAAVVGALGPGMMAAHRAPAGDLG